MLIGGLEPCTLIDVPEKIAATIFTIGCAFRCAYCHNPDLVIPSQYRTPLSSDAVISFLKSRIGKLQAVCISGGEPTLHHDLKEFIHTIKKLGYFIKLDTSGILPDRLMILIEEGIIDYIAMDIKAPIETYDTITKAKNAAASITQSVNLIMNSGIDYEFRTTVAKPILSVNDFHGIGTLIQDAKRHFIQNYVQAPKQVDTTIQLHPFCEQELTQAHAIMQQYVKAVTVR